MRVHVPSLWDRDTAVDYSAESIELARIVPRAGQRRRVWLDKYDLIEEGQQINCIWQPPFTEINGWMDQPSEIAASCVVTGTAHPGSVYVAQGNTEGEDFSEVLMHQRRVVDIDVQGVAPFLDTLATSAPDFTFKLPTCGSGDGKSISMWLESGRASSAQVGDYIYLTTYSSEVLLEALVRTVNGQLVLAYHAYFPPCGTECLILNKPLEADERAVFKQLMSIAEPIGDSYKPYLL